jgi:hypothetical protein
MRVVRYESGYPYWDRVSTQPEDGTAAVLSGWLPSREAARTAVTTTAGRTTTAMKIKSSRRDLFARQSFALAPKS